MIGIRVEALGFLRIRIESSFGPLGKGLGLWGLGFRGLRV